MAAKLKHDYLSILSNGKVCQITIKDDVEKDLYKLLEEFLKEKLKFCNKKKAFLVNVSNIDAFLADVDDFTEEWNEDEEEDEDADEEEEDDEDDEEEDEKKRKQEEEDRITIQEAFARRLRLKSRGEMIEDDHISESEQEDRITTTRRIRYLLKVAKELKELRERVEKLENKK
jgi:hypothetical protein